MKRRTLTAQLDTLKAERNDAVKADALVAKSQGGLPEATTAARRKLGDRITGLESELRQIETTLEAKALFVPNPPLPDVPEEQAILRSWGTPAPKGGKPRFPNAACRPSAPASPNCAGSPAPPARRGAVDSGRTTPSLRASSRSGGARTRAR